MGLKGRLAPGPSERHDLDADETSFPVLQDLLLRYGDICHVRGRTRAHDGLVVHDPDVIRRVLLGNRANYVKGTGTERVCVLLGNGLICSDGDHWARQRRLMQPAFQGRVVREFAPLMQRVNQDLVDRWAAVAARGEPVDLTRELSDVALTIVLRALFGDDLDRLIATEGGNPFDLLTRESQRDMPFAARFRGLTRFVRAMVEARRHERRVERDWLSMLMTARDGEGDAAAPMADRALVDEVMTLIVAGHETTASTLNWTWHLLSQHAGVEAGLHAAVVDAPAGGAPVGGYAERVLQEALRLYPPVWLFTRRAVGDDELGGHHVPAGTDVFICPYLLHRRPAHWDRPEAFDPERFAPDAAAGRHPFAYLPFSAGPRLCIGAGFATAEMATHLGLVARRFRLRPVDAAPPQPEFQINLRTRQPLRMRLEAL